MSIWHDKLVFQIDLLVREALIISVNCCYQLVESMYWFEILNIYTDTGVYTLSIKMKHYYGFNISKSSKFAQRIWEKMKTCVSWIQGPWIDWLWDLFIKCGERTSESEYKKQKMLYIWLGEQKSAGYLAEFRSRCQLSIYLYMLGSRSQLNILFNLQAEVNWAMLWGRNCLNTGPN